MLALLQRVTEARVTVAGECIARIDTGLLAFIGVERGDSETQAERMVQRLLGYRIFSDADDHMNLSVQQIHGGLLLVPQFTLPADTHKGARPSFTPAAPPEQGKIMYDHLLNYAKTQHDPIQSGRFGANMQVALVNDGPVTFMLQVPPLRPV